MSAIEKFNSLGKYTLNPRGNLWLNDENKIGHKLLSKMGWQRGKGLGKNEDGIRENLKVKFKNSNTGVGWKDKLSIGIQNEEFDALLNNLNRSHLSAAKELNKDSEKSLVQRCQKFQKRLHYQKFVKGKDVSRYSEKDMKSIFVHKKRKTQMEEQPLCEESNTSNFKNASLENSTSDLMVTYSSNSSIADYFAQKMKEKTGSLLNYTSVNPKEQSSNCTESLLSNEIQEIKSSPNDTIVTSKKRKKSSKNSKSKKRKINKVSNFKTRLKSITSENKFLEKMKKRVSFNESVSYQEIPCVLDDDVEFENSEYENGINEQKLNENYDVQNFRNNEENGKNEFVETHNNNHCENLENDSALDESDHGDINSKKEVECERTSEVFDESDDVYLETTTRKTSSTSNYNSWLENQRIAMKMNIYKNMREKIKNHNVLGTTNLLQIKGYGNWGF